MRDTHGSPRRRRNKIMGLLGVLAMVAAVAAFTPGAGADLRSDDRDLFVSQDSVLGGGNIAGVAEPNDNFGRAVAFGDFDNDGYDDMVVGVTGEDSGSGAINVIYGTENGLTGVGDQLFSQNSVGCCGPEANDNFGYALAVGNFDGDAYDDLAIGVPFEDQGGTSNDGLVHVFYGTASGLSATGNDFWQQGVNGFPGASEAGDFMGRALAAGDYNGDGRDDLAVGLPGESQGPREDAGWVVVLFGQPAGLSSAGNRPIVDDAFGGDEPDDSFGRTLETGDFNGDGVDDLAVGAPGEARNGVTTGAVTIWHGVAGTGPSGTTSTAAFTLHDFDATPDSGDNFGFGLAAGNFNGDDADDLVVGARGADSPLQVNGGVLASVYGSTTDGLTLDGAMVLSAGSGGVPSLPSGVTGLGRYVTSGEFDGDDYDDVIASTDSARVLVLHGAQGGLGGDRGHVIGQRVHSLGTGDIDGDGVDDAAMGNVNATIGGDANAGHVFVRFGTETATCNGETVTVNIANGEEPTEGDDVIVGTEGDDEINGLGGDDIICALGGDDDVRGGPGADFIDAGPGADTARGGGGQDIVRGEGGDDRLWGNSARDTVRGGTGDDIIRGGSAADLLVGNGGEDTIFGNGGPDTLRGKKNDDVLNGGKGNDILRGNAGRDTLNGGPGDDDCRGGTGADTQTSC